jgi:hypothetical protein
MSARPETAREPRPVREISDMTDQELLDWYAWLVVEVRDRPMHGRRPPPEVIDVDAPGPPAGPQPPTIEQLREAYALTVDEDWVPSIEGESRLHRAAHKLKLAHR